MVYLTLPSSFCHLFNVEVYFAITIYKKSQRSGDSEVTVMIIARASVASESHTNLAMHLEIACLSSPDYKYHVLRFGF